MPISLNTLRTLMQVDRNPQGLDLESFRRIMSAQAEDTNNSAPDRQLFRRLAALSGRINTNNDEFISLAEIQAVARLGGNGTDNDAIEAADLDNLAAGAAQGNGNPIAPPQPNGLTLIADDDNDIPEAIRNYRVTHTPGADLIATDHRIVQEHTHLGTVRLQGNTFARFFIDRDANVHVLVFNGSNFNANTSLVREYTIPAWSLNATLGHRIKNGQYDPASGNLLRDYIFSNAGTRRLLDVGSLDFSRLHAIPGVRYREARGLPNLDGTGYRVAPGSPEDPHGGGSNPHSNCIPTSLRPDAILPALQGQINLVNDDTTSDLFTQYYSGDTGQQRLNITEGGSTIEFDQASLKRGRLFRLGSNRVGQLVRVQVRNSNPPRYEYRLLVKNTDGSNWARFEEYRITQEQMQSIVSSQFEHINWNDTNQDRLFNSIENFVMRRFRGEDHEGQNYLLSQRGYVTFGNLLSNYGVKVRINGPGENSSPTYFHTSGGANPFQRAITSVTGAALNNWRTSLSYTSSGVGVTAPEIYNGALPTAITSHDTEVNRYYGYQANPIVRNPPRTQGGVRPILTFSFTNSSNTTEYRRIYLETNSSGQQSFFIVSWTAGGTPTFRSVPLNDSVIERINNMGLRVDQALNLLTTPAGGTAIENVQRETLKRHLMTVFAYGEFNLATQEGGRTLQQIADSYAADNRLIEQAHPQLPRP